MDNQKNDIKSNNDNWETSEPSAGLDKQAAQRMAEEEGADNPCGYCNRGDCVECRFSR